MYEVLLNANVKKNSTCAWLPLNERLGMPRISTCCVVTMETNGVNTCAWLHLVKVPLKVLPFWGRMNKSAILFTISNNQIYVLWGALISVRLVTFRKYWFLLWGSSIMARVVIRRRRSPFVCVLLRCGSQMRLIGFNQHPQFIKW